MTLPVTGTPSLVLAVVFGFIFGLLLQRGRVANYNVIVNQFRLKDFTVLKVMFTAIVVGGVGVLALHQMGHAAYHIKPANMLGVILGAGIFRRRYGHLWLLPWHWRCRCCHRQRSCPGWLRWNACRRNTICPEFQLGQ